MSFVLKMGGGSCFGGEVALGGSSTFLNRPEYITPPPKKKNFQHNKRWWAGTVKYFRNFKEHKGRYRRKRREEKPVLEGDLSTGNFYEIHKSWFTEYAQLLVSLNLSNNQLNKIPKEVLNLPSLRIIDLSANDLYDLPEIDNVEDSR